MMSVIFIAAIGVAFIAWIYGMRYFVPLLLAGLRNRPVPDGYGKKVARAVAVFFAAVGFALLVGFLGFA